MNNLKKEWRFRLVAVLVVFAIFYIWFLFHHKIGAYGVETDFYGLYAKDAQRILHGQMVQERDHGPGYAILLAMLTLPFRDVFTGGKVLSFFSALGTMLLGSVLFKKLLDERIAFWSGILTGIALIPYSFVVNIDIVFTFFSFLSLWCFYEFYWRKRTGYLITAALLSGIATMIRYNGILLPAGMIVLIIFLGERSKKVWARVRLIGVYLVFFLIPVLPWESYLIFAEKNASSPGLNEALAWEYYGPGGRFDGDQRMSVENQKVHFKYRSFREYVSAHPAQFFKHYAKNLFSYVDQLFGSFFPFPASHLVLAGLFLYLLFADTLQLSVLIFPFFAYLGISLIHFYSRYYLFVLPFLAVFAISFLFTPLLKEKRNRLLSVRWLRGIVLVWILITALRISLIKASDIVHNEPRYLISFVKELKATLPSEGARILARKPHLGYLAGIEAVYFPRVRTVSELVAFAKKNKVRYIEYGKAEREYRPQLSVLLYPDSVKAYLSPVVMDLKNGEIVYRIK